MTAPEPIKIVPGDDMHMNCLMAPFGLTMVTGEDRKHLLAFGRAAFFAGKKFEADRAQHQAGQEVVAALLHQLCVALTTQCYDPSERNCAKVDAAKQAVLAAFTAPPAASATDATVARDQLPIKARLMANGLFFPRGEQAMLLRDMADEIERILAASRYSVDLCTQALDTVREQTAEIAALRLDAERYRWLRSIGRSQVSVLGHYAGEALDAATDKAMACPDDKYSAAPTIAQPDIPAGFKLVPLEPTEEMRRAATRGREIGTQFSVQSLYRAMLAAAPEPIAQAVQP